MYNRYIPTEDGTYRRQRVGSESASSAASPAAASAPPAASTPPRAPLTPQPQSMQPRNGNDGRFDTDELLLVVILLLLLLDDQDEDLSLLIAALAFLML